MEVGTASGDHAEVHTRRQIMRNSAWNAAQQVALMSGGSLFSLVLAFYLPISEYGMYSYALALCSVGTAISSAGLHGLGVRYLVDAPQRSGALLAAMIAIREAFAVGAMAVLVVVSLTSGDSTTVLICAFMLTTLLSRALDTTELWYLANLRSSVTAKVRIGVTLLMLMARVVALVSMPNVWVFAGLYVAEACAATGLILIRYSRDKASQRLERPRAGELVVMTRRSRPLAASSVANQVNLKADVVVIQAMSGSASVGIYSVASRVGELAYFLPVVIMNSTLPTLVREKRSAERTGDLRRYDLLLQRSYDRAFAAGLVVAVMITLVCLSPIDHLMPSPLDRSLSVLAVYIWATPAVFVGAVYSKWILVEDYLWASFARHASGGVVNVALNILLIPHFDLIGAASATVTSYVVANYLFCFVGQKSRRQAVMMSRAVVSPFRYIINGAARVRFQHSNDKESVE